MHLQFTNWGDIVRVILYSAGAILAALLLHCALFAIFKRIANRSVRPFYRLFLKRQARPTRLLLPLLALLAVMPWLPASPAATSRINHAVVLALIGCIGWLLITTLDVTQDLISERETLELKDNLAARRLRTQVQVLRHIAVVVIVVITLATMVMTFPSARHVGESLFASAGLAAVVAGLAARTTLSNLLAGVQIAISQPIRLEDAVIVEGEWGWIEQITMTYVVVRVWDLRRLIVPISYFIEKPFQNWTRNSADLLGTALIYTDYSVPVAEVRAELHRILVSSGMWDGKTWGLQVTNATERTMELRALMSAPSGPAAWDLRCYVRERLIAFLQQNYPQSFPRTRAEITQKLAPGDGHAGNGDHDSRDLSSRRLQPAA